MNEFDQIYAQGGWDGCGSGSGSTPQFCRAYNAWLNGFMNCQQIKTVLDLGCGDWQSTHLLDWSGRQYWGIDIASQVIKRNRRLYGRGHVHFMLGDFLTTTLPKAHLLIVKDVIHHLKHEQVVRTVEIARTYQMALWVVDMGAEVPHGAWPDSFLMDYFRSLRRVFDFDTNQPGYKYGPKVALLSWRQEQ